MSHSDERSISEEISPVALVGVLLEHPNLLQYCQRDLDYVAVPGEIYLIDSDMGIGLYV